MRSVFTTSSTYEDIVKVLSQHYSPKQLLIAERLRSHKRDQEEGESVTMFVAELRKLAEYCEFGEGLNDTLALEMKRRRESF